MREFTKLFLSLTRPRIVAFCENNFTELKPGRGDIDRSREWSRSLRDTRSSSTRESLSDCLEFYSPHDPLADLVSSEYVERVTKETVYGFAKLYSSS